MTTQKQTTTKKEWTLFIGVMVIFIAGMIALMIAKITNVWIWIGYLWLWSYAEIKIAKNIQNIHLKWWMWGVLIAMLCLLDFVLISIFH